MNSDNEEAEEFTSPLDVYKRLVEAVINEELSPELLLYEETVVECIADQVQHMKNSLVNLGSKLDSFCVEQHQIELERFTFVLNKYYRTRIEKIEQNAQRLIKLLKEDHRQALQLMSPQEVKYLDNYINSTDEYLSSFLQKMPRNMRSFKMLDIPPDAEALENTYIFVKSKKDTTLYVEDAAAEQTDIEMKSGGQHFLPYPTVKPVLQSGSKSLIIL